MSNVVLGKLILGLLGPVIAVYLARSPVLPKCGKLVKTPAPKLK